MSIGVHVHQTLETPDAFRSIPWRWVMMLSTDLHLLSQVRELAPQAEIMVRYYDPDVMAESPEDRAAEFCDLLTETFGWDSVVDCMPANELDLAHEHGGKALTAGDIGYPWSSPEGLAVIADWLSRAADAHRRLRPQDTLHLPACSAAMPLGTWWLAMPTHKFDVLDQHIYDFRYPPARSSNNTPIAVTEWGKIGGTPEEYAAFARALKGIPNALWKWSGPPPSEGDPGGYAIFNREDVLDALRDISHDDIEPEPKPDDEDKEEDNVDSELELMRQWRREYKAAHEGLNAEYWEFRKYQMANDEAWPITQADIDAVREDRDSAQRQLDLLEVRLGL